jgi:catechol 2,3-dioxygenase-like lactoylglutathione lyase family enzyme
MKLTPVLIVDAIEPCLAFWVDRLGFQATVTVPHGDGIGFVILVQDKAELMYQTRASVADDAPETLDPRGGHSAGLFIEVPDLAAIERALDGVPLVLPRRTTFYGMDEIGVHAPGGHVVVFAQPSAKT